MTEDSNKTISSEVLRTLKASDDPVDRDVAEALLSIQESRALRGEPRSIGYEPRDINRYGALEVIQRRIRGEASGFNEVGPNDSYEAIVLKYPDQFAPDVVEIANKRIETDQREIASTSDKSELYEMAIKLLARDHFPFPKGNPEPKRSEALSSSFIRDPYIVAWILKSAAGRCEACNGEAPFVAKSGRPYLEVHHVKPLGERGSDRVSNAVALCPNCHRAMHFADDAKSRATSLIENISRLIAE